MLAHRSTNKHTCPLAEKFSRDVSSAQNKTLILPLPATVPSKLSSRFLRKCVMAQRSATSFGPAGGATARWPGHKSKIGSTTLSASPLAARGCKKSCRRLRLARVMPPEALGCHDWTSHSRDTPTRGHHTPRFVIKAIQGDLHVLFRH